MEALPREFGNAVLWLPMVHGVELIRDGFFGSRIEAHYDVAYMVGFNTMLTIMALALERAVSRDFVPE